MLQQLKRLKLSLGKYFWNVLVALDQLGNALTGGDPDETISSRTGKIVLAWKGRDRKWTIAYWLYTILDKIQYKHCERSIEDDEGKDSVL